MRLVLIVHTVLYIQIILHDFDVDFESKSNFAFVSTPSAQPKGKRVKNVCFINNFLSFPSLNFHFLKKVQTVCTPYCTSTIIGTFIYSFLHANTKICPDEWLGSVKIS
jgi:hypothetical protein